MVQGMRVFAVRSTDPATATVEFFGLGVYTGMHMHPDYGMFNPKIELDNGKTVWGIECWWGPEDHWPPPGNWTVIEVDPDA